MDHIPCVPSSLSLFLPDSKTNITSASEDKLVYNILNFSVSESDNNVLAVEPGIYHSYSC